MTRLLLRSLKVALGLFCLVIGWGLLLWDGAAIFVALSKPDGGLPLLRILGAMVALAILGASFDLLTRRRTAAAPQTPPPTRDAWDGGFQDMDSANDKMSKGR